VVEVLGTAEAVLHLWQEITGRRLNSARRGEFLARPAASELARFSERRLRRAAMQVDRSSWLMLKAWLDSAHSVDAVPPQHRGPHFDDSNSGRVFDPHPRGPANSALHRRIGRTQRYEEDT